jgi:lactoylglutathione lyase
MIYTVGMKFGYTIIYVRDIIKTIEFYERAFGMTRKFVHESNTYAEMLSGETTLAFAEDDFARSLTDVDHHKNLPDATASGFEIALITDDVQASYEKAISGGASKVSAPETKPWGQSVAYVRDFNGVLVEIASPIGE